MAVSFLGENCAYWVEDASIEFCFLASEKGVDIAVAADLLRRRPLEQLDYGEARDAAAHAGMIRHFQLPRFLWYFNKAIRDVFVQKGKRPFWKYRLDSRGENLPVSYQPHGPWKLEPERGPFDFSTTASLAIPHRYLHDRPLVDLLEELYNTRSRFINPATVSVRLQSERQN